MLPTLEIEAIIGLISIHLYLQKISSRHQLRIISLLLNYIINSFLEYRHSKKLSSYLKKITTKQWLKSRVLL